MNACMALNSPRRRACMAMHNCPRGPCMVLNGLLWPCGIGKGTKASRYARGHRSGGDLCVTEKGRGAAVHAITGTRTRATHHAHQPGRRPLERPRPHQTKAKQERPRGRGRNREHDNRSPQSQGNPPHNPHPRTQDRRGPTQNATPQNPRGTHSTQNQTHAAPAGRRGPARGARQRGTLEAPRAQTTYKPVKPPAP